jgi:hypothetical protein
MLTKRDARRRWFGMLFLILSGGMLAWGLTFLKAYLMSRPLLFIFYWLGCFGFTLLALVTAALDMFIVKQRTRDEKGRIFRSAFNDKKDDAAPRE